MRFSRTTGDQSEARFVFRPDLDFDAGMLSNELENTAREPPFLKASWASLSASGCLGRGVCCVNPAFTRYTQPVPLLTGVPVFSSIQAATFLLVYSPPSGAARRSAWASSWRSSRLNTGSRPFEKRPSSSAAGPPSL